MNLRLVFLCGTWLETSEIRAASQFSLKRGDLKISSSNAFSQLNSPILHTWWPFHLSVFGRTVQGLQTLFLNNHTRPARSPMRYPLHHRASSNTFFENLGLTISRQGVPGSKWNHKFHLASFNQTYQQRTDIFLGNQGFIKTAEYKWILQSTFATFATWKPAPGRQGDWHFSLLQNPVAWYFPDLPRHFLKMDFICCSWNVVCT